MGWLNANGIWIGRNRGGGISWQTFWSSLISATVENAAPTNVVMTFGTANTTLIATDFTIAGKTVTLLERDATNKILTLTLSTPIVHTETPVVTFEKTAQTKNITNNTLPLLDNYEATIAYSTRLLRSDYAGNCIKVRRSSDDSTQDIGFVDGLLNETALLAFCGAGDGYIDTFYDQSGNTQDLIQPTTTKQPLIVSGGAILKVNERQYLSFDGTDDGLYKMTCALFKNIGAISLFTINQYKANPVANSSVILISILSNNASRFLLGAGIPPNKYFTGGRRLDGNSLKALESVGDVGTGQKQITSINDYTNSDQYLYINGNLDRKDDSFQTNGVTANTNSFVVNIGGNVAASGGEAAWSNVNIWEVIVYASDQSANRLSIEANQRSFFFNLTPLVDITTELRTEDGQLIITEDSNNIISE